MTPLPLSDGIGTATWFELLQLYCVLPGVVFVIARLVIFLDGVLDAIQALLWKAEDEE